MQGGPFSGVELKPAEGALGEGEVALEAHAGERAVEGGVLDAGGAGAGGDDILRKFVTNVYLHALMIRF
jgi:hypothetical protein